MQGALEALSSEVVTIKAENGLLRDQLEAAKAERVAMQAELTGLKALSAQLDTLSASSTAQNDSIAAINSDLETLESAVQNPVCPEDMANSGIGCVELQPAGPYTITTARSLCSNSGRRLCSASELWVGCEAAGGLNFNIGANEWIDDWVSTQDLSAENPLPIGSYIIEHVSIQWDGQQCIVGGTAIALGSATQALVRCCAPHQIVIPSDDDPAPEPGQ